MPDKNVLTLTPENLFRRADESNDDNFYALPRFVAHIDNAAINVVTNLYCEFFPANGAIIDLMSSWISHLPKNVGYKRVAGLGMNREELNANERLTERIVQSLNEKPQLPFADNDFDAAAICVSVQYLIDPVAVFREIGRVLRKNAPLVITFSNRCFPTKAVFAWNALDDNGHIALVREYFTASQSFAEPEIRRHEPRRGDPLFALVARRK